MPARLSAFAAAKAKAANQIASDTPSEKSVAGENAANRSQNGHAHDTNYLPTLLSSFPLTKAQELDDASSDDAQDAANYSDEDGNYSRAYHTAPFKSGQPCKLSTLAADKFSTISDEPDRLTLKLEPEETATFIGEYDLEVRSGIIMVYGAVLRAGPKPHRIFAPTTHALPVIVAKGGVAEIVVISTNRSMHGLSKVSPLWTKLWHQPSRELQDSSAQIRSFALVCAVIHI